MPHYGAPTSQKDGISPHLKVTIQSGDLTVSGYLTEGSSKTITASYEQPLLASLTGGLLSAPAMLLQGYTDYSIITQQATTVVWGGTEPIRLDLELAFKAIDSPENEVNLAIESLERMISPLFDKAIGTTVPADLTVRIGTRLMFNEMAMTSVSSPITLSVDSNGFFMRGSASISLQSKKTLAMGEIQGGVYIPSGEEANNG